MKHKRRWTWKKKHVRRHQSSKAFLWGMPPKSYRRPYHRANRAKERMDLRKIKMGFEDVDTSPKHHPSSAYWDWY